MSEHALEVDGRSAQRSSHEWDIGCIARLKLCCPACRAAAFGVAEDRGRSMPAEVRRGQVSRSAHGVEHRLAQHSPDDIRMPTRGAEPRVVGQRDDPALSQSLCNDRGLVLGARRKLRRRCTSVRETLLADGVTEQWLLAIAAVLSVRDQHDA